MIHHFSPTHWPVQCPSNRRAPKIAFLAALSLLPFLSPLLHAEQEGDFEYSSDGNAITITKYSGKAVKLTIPDKIAGLPVRIIGRENRFMAGAFDDANEITSVTIPSGVTTIEGSFVGCKNLTHITIPSSVTSIGSRSFQACNKLTSITLPPNLSILSDHLFYGCDLTSVVIPPKVSNIGEFAFSSNERLTTATYQGNAPAMGKSVFIGAAPNFTIRYYKGSTGFTTPEWNGYKSIEIDPLTQLFDWVSKDSKTIKAKFVNLDGEAVVVRKEDGTEHKIPFTRLSSDSVDQAKMLSGGDK